MRKPILGLGLLGILVAASDASEGKFGLGFIAGAPSGISAKIPSGSLNAVDVIVGWHFFPGGGAFYTSADYVWENPNIFPPVPQGKFILYYGPGAGLAAAGGGAGVGVRFVGGIEYLFPDVPLDAFLELGPGIGVLPGIGPFFSAGIGVRYFF